MRRLPLIALAFAALAAPASASPLQRANFVVRISGATPYPQGCGVQGEQTPSSEAEPYIAANPADPQQVIAIYQQDRFAVDGGALSNLVSISGDGGRSFRQLQPPNISRCSGGAKERTSDPWISYGPDGTAYAAHLTFDENPALAAAGLAGPTALSSQTSTDGGNTWADPVSIVDENIYDDREAITADPNRAGHAYVAWVRRLGSFGENGTLEFAKTADGGKTWSAPKGVYTPGPFKLPDPILIDVMPDGTLVATFVVINASYAVSSTPVPFDIMSVRSTDDGETWSTPIKIAETVSTTPKEEESGSEVRSLAIVSTARTGSTLHVAWNEIRGDEDSLLAMATSTDGATTWSKPRQIAHIAGQAFLPALAAHPDGTLGLVWDDTRNDQPGDKQLTTDVWFASSADSGKTWSEAHVLGPFDALTASETSSTKVAGHFIGDYQGLTALPGAFGAAVAVSKPDAKDGPSDVFFARLVPSTGGPAPGPKLKLVVRPRTVAAGKRVRLLAVVTSGKKRIAGALIRVGGRKVKTAKNGRARIVVRFKRPGRKPVRASKTGYHSRTAYVRAKRR